MSTGRGRGIGAIVPIAMDLGITRLINHRGVAVPTMLYGTAWKEAETERLAREALEAGFLGIDTANQRKHYDEAEVGRAVRTLPGDAPRPFLQTKFTYPRGQDHRLPYDPQASPGVQVRQSFDSSCEHLGVDVIDSYLLHGPEAGQGLTAGDWQVWRAMERLHDEGGVRLIGISNARADQVRELVAGARVAPAFVQNRFYFRENKYGPALDAEVRSLCHTHDIVYQGFSILTANRAVWAQTALHPIARRIGGTPAQVLFRYAMHLGILPLTGTSNAVHMRADLAYTSFTLTAEEQATIAALSHTGGGA